ncbi:hypothetical protein EG329_005360 [Mollisiaceae sp. DMI_Dod_QoI]|nr:hypothetical protein EG329_005360 [Helotiales sp. DMI_Dod_QoI]
MSHASGHSWTELTMWKRDKSLPSVIDFSTERQDRKSPEFSKAPCHPFDLTAGTGHAENASVQQEMNSGGTVWDMLGLLEVFFPASTGIPQAFESFVASSPY